MTSNAFSSNCGYGITCIDAGYIRPQLAAFYLMEEEGELAIIETGTQHSVSRAMQTIVEAGYSAEQVRYIIPTHVHLDHAGGAGALMAACPNAQLVVHPRGARHLISPQKLIEGTVAVYGQEAFDRLYGSVIPVAEDRVISADDGYVVELAGRPLLIRHTPGHAEHHFCIWDQRSRGWFSGDNFGICYPELQGQSGRYILPSTTPVQFDPDRYLASLDLMMAAQPERIFLTHFNMIEEVAELAEIQRQSIHDYIEIARSCAGSDDVAAAIQSALIERELLAVNRFLPELDGSLARELLSVDMRLNADGLAVWLQRS